MFLIYGWLKEVKPVKWVMECYCYVCQRNSEWHVCRESEWVTFFGVKTIPFLSKEFLVCARCADDLLLQKSTARQLMAGQGIEAAIANLEQHQLASKTEVQRNFLLSSRSARGGQ